MDIEVIKNKICNNEEITREEIIFIADNHAYNLIALIKTMPKHQNILSELIHDNKLNDPGISIKRVMYLPNKTYDKHSLTPYKIYDVNEALIGLNNKIYQILLYDNNNQYKHFLMHVDGEDIFKDITIHRNEIINDILN